MAAKSRKPAGARGATRAELLEEHAAARHRRDAAPLGGAEFREAVADLARIEVAIATLERAMDPPKV